MTNVALVALSLPGISAATAAPALLREEQSIATRTKLSTMRRIKRLHPSVIDPDYWRAPAAGGGSVVTWDATFRRVDHSDKSHTRCADDAAAQIVSSVRLHVRMNYFQALRGAAALFVGLSHKIQMPLARGSGKAVGGFGGSRQRRQEGRVNSITLLLNIGLRTPFECQQ
jgi:hypothetical protein